MTAIPNSPAARDIAFALHPYTNLGLHQREGALIIREGKGIYVYDEAGKSYVEGLAGLWCTALGFGEERLVETAAEAMRKLSYYHQFGAKAHEPGINLAEKLIEVAPVEMSKVFFTNSGSEANDTVVKIVWYYNSARGKPEKRKIISRIKGYHGVTVAAASLTGLPHVHKHFNLPIADILHTSCPHYYRYGEAGETEEDFATRMAADLENMILEEGPETVAAFIAEPIMGAAGVLTPPATYFAKVQAVLKKYDVLFVADEVICGFGRTGNYWGSQTYDLKPDIISMAKALSSAYLPIAAVMINDEIFQGLVKGSDEVGMWGHGYTYTGHPVAAAVAMEALKIYDERDLFGHARRVAPALQDGMRKFADHPLVGEIRGIGLIGAIELIKDKEAKTAFETKDGVGAFCSARAQENGLITRAMGDAIGFCPPLIIDENGIGEILDIFSRSLDETWEMVQAKGLA